MKAKQFFKKLGGVLINSTVGFLVKFLTKRFSDKGADENQKKHF